MIQINGYQLYEENSTPIRTVYRGHHKTRQPHRSCTVQAIFEEDVPQSYKQYMKCPYFDLSQPQTILLKHIFTSPQHPHLIFFVQYEPTQFRSYLNQDLQRNFLCVFQITSTLFRILRKGLVHDLSLENIAIGRENTYFCNFVINGKKQMEASHIKRQTELAISQLLANDEQDLGSFTVGIADKLDSVSLRWSKKMANSEVNMSYCFQLGPSNNEVISISSIRYLDGVVINSWQKQIAPSELLSFIPQYDSCSKQWRIPSVVDQKPFKSRLQVDEAGGIFGDKATIIDNNQDFPYNAVGAFTSIVKNKHGQQKQRFGTAVLVSQNLIMTCAHNLLCQINDQVYKATVEDMIFTHNQKDYRIKDFRLNERYRQNIMSKDRYKYDYALLQLEEKIDMKLFVEIVQNYKETELELKMKGFYGRKGENIIKSKLIPVGQFCFKQKQTILAYVYSNKDKASEGGFSGAPIFIILAELSQNFKYHFMIGIHNSGYQGQNGYATFFTEEIIEDFAKWQQELTPGGKRFQNILDFSKITNLDQVCESMRAKLDDVVFNPIQKEYFPKLFAQVKYSKLSGRSNIENMYKQALRQDRRYGWKENDILLEMGSSNYQQRHNNIIFMYHLRHYENWFAPWQSFGQSQGLVIFYIYIVIQLEAFFTRAKLSKQQQQFKKFQQFLTNQVERSYEQRKYCKVAAINVHFNIATLQSWLKKISMNDNFRKMLLIEVEFLKCLYTLFIGMKRDSKLFEVSKICVLGFLAKEFFTKIVEVDKHMKHYLFVFNEIILISIKYLIEEEMILEAREAKFSFAWSVRMLIKDHPSLRDDLLRFDPNHQVLLSKEQRERRQDIENMIKNHFFGEEVTTYLRRCMKMIFK